MSLATYASPYNNEESYSNIDKKPKIKNKTLKRRDSLNNRISNNPKLENMMKTIHNIEDDNDNLENFNPLDPPELSTNFTSGHEHITNNQVENFDNLQSEYAKQYYQQYAPNSNSDNNFKIDENLTNDELMKKLNYIIYLLEEQQNEPTNRVTEEIVLYSFLGVFIIFIVDSFARVGKYVR